MGGEPKSLTAVGNPTLFRDNWQLVKQLLFRTLHLSTSKTAVFKKGEAELLQNCGT
jgi:hypothetical protein